MIPGERAMIRDDDVAGRYARGVDPYILRVHGIGMRLPEAIRRCASAPAAEPVA